MCRKSLLQNYCGRPSAALRGARPHVKRHGGGQCGGQSGFVIIAAIFLLVVIAAIGGFMLTIGALSNSSSGLDVEGAKAYQAARAGIEWGVFQKLRNSTCPATTSFTPGGTLSTYTVSVTGTAMPYSEITASTGSVCSIVSTACNRSGSCPGTPGDNYVERQLQVSVDK